jgi:hypothetical protein
MTLYESITFGFALLGAVLGVMNTWNAINRTRVRLRVSPSYLIAMPNGDPFFGIEVVNLSSFPVTIAEAGFFLPGRQRSVIVEPLWGVTLPRRLESREAVTIAFHPGEMAARKDRIGKAFCKTACGVEVSGDSPARRQLAQIIQS